MFATFTSGAGCRRQQYESPFTDLSPAGPEVLFSAAQVDKIVAVLHEVRAKVA